ncbi:tetratricopeptide repeat protein [Schleiferilactobacillus perolens]|jgi:tetratricopeptide (TPR) repeat protein|uniref:tetratricopeptide repeat protein n=1 Tax=Schleiferilactobacillus perolens TaxID=100468 RepID=UPI002352868E|nr:tetratricopeptide repeat protein [Schleiferilactobacillus perolens]MCI1892298.1 tetratricopeptide repeat protein [Schleiferilactobacillus harbinensis]MCI1913176.1 tetratricopeptide repeat protein [Schleiferilactobacillus harbinensis]MCI2171280.1 tetratricopeptide repeat protein [Schleiferilactobacillus perolens]
MVHNQAAPSTVAAQVHALVQQIDRDPKDRAAIIELAHLLVAQHDLKQAAALLTKGLGLMPNDPLLQYNLAVVYTTATEYPAAQKLLDQVNAPELLSDKAYTQAQIFFNQKQFPKALAFALTAVEKRPTDSDYQLLYGDVLSALEKWSLAIPALQEAVKLAPHQFKPHFDLAVALLGDGQVAAGQTAMARAKALDPHQFKHQESLFQDIGTMLHDQGKGSQPDAGE